MELERRKTEGKRGGEGFKNERNMSEETKGTWGQARGWIKTSTKLGYNGYPVRLGICECA